jgi:hypothetical protein
MKERKSEIDKILEQQAEKGIKRWMVVASLTHKGFSEKQIAKVMGCDARTVHAMKFKSRSTGERHEMKNYFVLDVIKMQGFIKNVKAIVGKPSHRKEK